MRAAVLRGGTFTVEDIAAPEPGEGQVLVETVACGICGSDLSAYRHTAEFLRASIDSDTPSFVFDPDADLVMGHELAARVVRPGPGVTGFEPGEVVVGLPWALDGGGVLRTIGFSNTFPGGFGERMVMQAAALVKVPGHVPPHVAALTEPLAVGFGNVARSGAERGGSAIVIGAGPIGLGAIAGLIERGVAPVVVSEPSPRRRELARAFGAHVVVDPAERDPFDAWRESAEPGWAPTVFECSGKAGMFDRITYAAPRGATVLLIGVCMTEDTFRPVVGIYKDLTVKMCLTYPPEEYPKTLARIAAGSVDAASLITGQVGFEGVAAAIDTLGRPDEHVKVLVRPHLTGTDVHPPTP
ncbi:zinc-binding dehydrogenase [Embleya hyalina]|uniref:Putative zinc-type alcohol dehydrogenase n=1 Tax=Embleya hyalina TaxID=516124 RepID=A0A401YTS5_9ACTN|nr:zinc-binding dehydrogenase [Embleya hyalina]GCD97982.1 putative zinc-type alcohol dehydrogenase [Embleya hyalina]